MSISVAYGSQEAVSISRNVSRFLEMCLPPKTCRASKSLASKIWPVCRASETYPVYDIYEII